MQLSIVDRHRSLNEETRELADRRLRYALSRFASRVEKVLATVTDLNGPRGGVDKSCQIIVKLRGAADVRVSSHDATIEGCLSRAASRATSAVARAIGRRRLPKRAGITPA